MFSYPILMMATNIIKTASFFFPLKLFSASKMDSSVSETSDHSKSHPPQSVMLQSPAGIVGALGFPGGASGKEPSCQCRRHLRDTGWIPKSGRSRGEGNGNPLQYFGKPHGQRSLVGYSPWSRKESNTTEVTYVARGHAGSLARAHQALPLLVLRTIWGVEMKQLV